MITCLHGMSPRRHHPPGATYELAKTVQTTGATSESIMGLMDQVGQAVGGMMGGQGGQNPLLQAVTSLLGKDSGIGGLAGLVHAFQKNGLGDLVNSWVSTGPNLPATPSQIEQGLGGDLLNQLAGKAGLSSGAQAHSLPASCQIWLTS